MTVLGNAQVIKREYMKLDDVEIQQSQCFVTSIFEVALVSGEEATAFNADLRAKIRAIRSSGEKGLDYGGAGWQTPHDLHERPGFAELFEGIHKVLFECARAESLPDELRPVVHSAWSNIEEKGHFVRNHMHPWAAWSGVYYVEVDDLTGDIFFEDPRPGAKALRWPHIEVERNVVSFHPRAGMLLLFPSFVEHYTDPSRSSAERICISFNASLGVPGGAPEIRR